MGKGLQRKQEEQFEYLQNESWREAADELLARIPPEKEHVLEVLSHSCLPADAQTLIARPTSDGKSIEFLHGDVVCGTSDVAIVNELGLPLAATLFAVVSDKDDVLTLRICPVDRKRFRPSVEDDDYDD